MRDQHSRPLVEAFFEWAEAEYAKVRDRRGLLRSAFGYVVRQREALRRFLEDGRLRLELPLGHLTVPEPPAQEPAAG